MCNYFKLVNLNNFDSKYLFNSIFVLENVNIWLFTEISHFKENLSNLSCLKKIFQTTILLFKCD